MERFFPAEQSEWPEFREWALVRTSCLREFRIGNNKNPISKPWNISLLEILLSALESGSYERLNASICELVEWMQDVEELDWKSYDASIYPYGRNLHRPYDYYQPKIKSALEQANDLRICSNRLWNTISGCPRKEFDLVGLMAAISHADSKSLFAHTESNSEHK